MSLEIHVSVKYPNFYQQIHAPKHSKCFQIVFTLERSYIPKWKMHSLADRKDYFFYYVQFIGLYSSEQTRKTWGAFCKRKWVCELTINMTIDWWNVQICVLKRDKDDPKENPSHREYSEWTKRIFVCFCLFVCLFWSVTFLDQTVGRGEALMFTRRLAWDALVKSHPALQCYLD